MKRSWVQSVALLALLATIGMLVCPLQADAATIKLWHSYQGDERKALEQTVDRFNKQSGSDRVHVLWVPYSAFIRRLNQAIPRGHGPDIFIFAHEQIGNWVSTGHIAPLPQFEGQKQHFKRTTQALRYKDKSWGLPLAYKNLVLFYNKKLIPKPPRNTNELIRLAKAQTNKAQHRYGLVFKSTDFYVHAAFLFGFGGKLFDDEGHPNLATPEMIGSLQFTHRLVHKHGIVPRNVKGDTITKLFNAGLAAMVINGPWFLGEIKKGLDFGVAPLPRIDESGKYPRPFVTVDAVFLSARAKHRSLCLKAMRFLTSDNSARTRAIVGKQLVANQIVYSDPKVRSDPIVKVFRAQLPHTEPMPNSPAMRFVWEPANRALRKVMRGAATPKIALAKAQRQIRLLMQPPPERQNPRWFSIIAGLLLLGLVGLWVRKIMQPDTRARMKKNAAGYAFAAPAALSLLALLIVPFLMGAAVAFFAYRNGQFYFVGAHNFIDILTAKEIGFTDPLSFYFTFAVTVLWTTVNVGMHLVIGVSLAMVLREKWVKLRGFYRVLFIIPWAIPNYITALAWRGIFDEEFGAMNGLLTALGAEPVNWFSHFWTAFCANLVTNMWLGFPFMMVVTLGALQSIPRDLEEAAAVDGASRWERFRHIILPLLGPALLPAVIMSTVWTFNMFNVIYLVSGGEPDGSTEIMISEAYKWAFDRYERYGYASAYAILIFLILLAYSHFTKRIREPGRA